MDAMKIVGETSRLYLREFLPEDSIHFYEMNKDPEVLRYTGDLPFASLEEAEEFIGNYKEYLHHGYGRWAVIRKEDEMFLGWCGLKFHPDKGITELGFRFYRKFWNRGYASEASRVAIDHAFAYRKLITLYAHVHSSNAPSQRVLEKLGFTFVKYFDYEGKPAKFFKLGNPDYRMGEIDAGEVLKVRHPVLRAGRPLEDAVFEGDTADGTFHLGAWYAHELVGVVTLMRRSSPRKGSPGDYQLRGMGVIDDFRSRGVGRALVEAAEEGVKGIGGLRIWMNAREKAVSFYEKIDYKAVGDLFEIAGVGPHLYMEKTFNQ